MGGLIEQEFFQRRIAVSELSFLALLHYQCLHRCNVSVNELICQQSVLGEQWSWLAEYDLYISSLTGTTDDAHKSKGSSSRRAGLPGRGTPVSLS